jgi:hypothetical protein
VSHQTLHFRGLSLLFFSLFFLLHSQGNGLSSALRKSSGEMLGLLNPAMSAPCIGLPMSGAAGSILVGRIQHSPPAEHMGVLLHTWVQDHTEAHGSCCQVPPWRYIPPGNGLH